ncbi:MAG: hypothetical protein ACYTEZ_05765 [Planctomycetota bacterium]|jgi:hypothetical protein
MVRLLVLLLLVLPAAAEEHVIRTEHYELRLDGERAQAEDYSRLLEAAWKQFQRYFKAKPKLKKSERLVIRHFPDEARWTAALQADGAAVPHGAGGYYWPQNRTVYVFRQPTRYYSRVLLLHEAAHQFHYLAKTRNRSPDAAWYTEGVAEYLSWHHWDGRTLELAVLPNVSLKDYAAVALTEARAAGFDLAPRVEGKAQTSRALSWALVRWLATGQAGKPLKRFEQFRRKLDGGVRPGPIFRKTIGPPAAVQSKFLAWLEQEQQPFGYVFNEWYGLGPGRLRGFFAQGTTVCRLKAPVTFFQATMEVPTDRPGWRGGVLLHYLDNTDYSVALLDWGGYVHIKRFVGQRFQTLERGEVTAIVKGNRYAFQLFRRKDRVTMMIGDVGFGPWELPGTTFGLAVERSDLSFRDVGWK